MGDKNHDKNDNCCFFCGTKRVYFPPQSLGISIGMGGYDFSFCKKCLNSMTANEFLEKIIRDAFHYDYPLKLEKVKQAPLQKERKNER